LKRLSITFEKVKINFYHICINNMRKELEKKNNAVVDKHENLHKNSR